MGNPFGVLYVVATPIGNLEDITIRALKILRQVDFIACEDTRKTRILTGKYHIKTRLIPYHEYNKKKAADKILESLIKGKCAALVSEAGTPLISDPGYHLVKLCTEKGIRVIPLPGASSLLGALSASGLDTSEFTFIGFLPKKEGKRKKVLEKLAGEERIFVVFEPARSVSALLDTVFGIMGNVKVCYAKELTKIYENIKTLRLVELKNMLEDNVDLLRGEITLVIEPASKRVLNYEENKCFT